MCFIGYELCKKRERFLLLLNRNGLNASRAEIDALLSLRI